MNIVNVLLHLDTWKTTPQSQFASNGRPLLFIHHCRLFIINSLCVDFHFRRNIMVNTRGVVSGLLHKEQAICLGIVTRRGNNINSW